MKLRVPILTPKQIATGSCRVADILACAWRMAWGVTNPSQSAEIHVRDDEMNVKNVKVSDYSKRLISAIVQLSAMGQAKAACDSFVWL